jgi:hypothetical protein
LAPEDVNVGDFMPCLPTSTGLAGSSGGEVMDALFPRALNACAPPVPGFADENDENSADSCGRLLVMVRTSERFWDMNRSTRFRRRAPHSSTNGTKCCVTKRYTAPDSAVLASLGSVINSFAATSSKHAANPFRTRRSSVLGSDWFSNDVMNSDSRTSD